jgi:myosin heavy subunit
MYSSLVEFIQSSTIPFIGTLFPEDVGDNKKAPTTASTKIRQSANYLVSV